jgi:hypothetical protein
MNAFLCRLQSLKHVQTTYCTTCALLHACCRPDLLLVERSVARSAQEELLQRGIALVQHTKPELLERLGRCMGIKVRLQCSQ